MMTDCSTGSPETGQDRVFRAEGTWVFCGIYPHLLHDICEYRYATDECECIGILSLVTSHLSY